MDVFLFSFRHASYRFDGHLKQDLRVDKQVDYCRRWEGLRAKRFPEEAMHQYQGLFETAFRREGQGNLSGLSRTGEDKKAYNPGNNMD